MLKAQSIKNGKFMAIKCMKNHFDSLDQVRLAWPDVRGCAASGPLQACGQTPILPVVLDR